MAGERVKLEVLARETRGDGPARRLRAEGLIPGILYGRSEPHAIAVEERELRRALHGPGGMHTILDVVVGGQSATHPSVLKDFQQHAVTGRLLHIDLQEVRLDQPITASVSVHLLGESPGAKEGGILSQQIREVSVEALPMEVPERLELDISSLQMGDSLRLADVAPLEGVTYLDDPDTVLVTVSAPRALEVEEVVVEEGEEGEALPEGESAPEAETETSEG